MNYFLYGLVSFLIGLTIIFLVTFFYLKIRNRPRKEFNLPNADEYVPHTDAVVKTFNSVDGKKAKDDFTVQ